MTFTNVFGGTVIYPANPSYKSYTSTTALSLVWPTEAAPNDNIVAAINDISLTTGLTVTLDDATIASVGQAPLFNNVGSQTFTVLGATGGTILTATAGAAWVAYLADNTTTGGTWRTFQMGAGTSSASAAALAGYGITAITTTLNQMYNAVSYATNPTFATGNRAELAVWTGGAGTGTLSSAVTLTNGWFINLRNQGTGAFTIVPSGGQLINAATSFLINPSDSVIIGTDGAAFYTIGFGQDAIFAFDYTSINVAGNGTYTLTGTELNRIAYKFTGALTGNREVAVPNTVQQYWVDNETTGAFQFSIRTQTEASPGTIVAQTARDITYSDGTIIQRAETVGLTAPVLISQGGTSATTAAGARTNLDVPQTLEAFTYALFVS